MKTKEIPGGALLKDFDGMPDVARVRMPVVAALYACCPRTVRNRIASGDIPAPEKRGGHLTWAVGDLRRSLGA
ncbi:transcriptional regulator [Ralstonia solanacearum P673]|uniref:transcriptional regulator n=1 Tax=Ralstonia solanacearum TaxID=305 RepID=UPI00190F9DED|nr:transcriptional regulator [Ralstonia solanacearum]MCL9851196.1 transcriptional regulator [Ralstonia solanacearum]MCL9855773.1 transcriptional regulator [Ralstonia solanacearum]MCL9860289.1 transcriptional regulator [Ralstonia solanacearum]MCL9865520.1 transcriptional regulator [Ralstonia solanacearum]MCL9870003.1 transcriptional regulator [Ralstonia solanacearum]